MIPREARKTMADPQTRMYVPDTARHAGWKGRILDKTGIATIEVASRARLA